ncbi:tRNA pseudouridine(13) synthase TruD, partial [Candidatus Woesearchaeota archaeon]|nr:tRNA pseudouridine(13) synthase TruD [Candidatus Woesearchaeota archaeon]
SKDRRAVTSQFMSVRGGSAKRLDRASIDNVSLEAVGRTEEPISLGDLAGNSFRITIRDIEKEPERRELVPNLFGEQRFGRNNADVGRAILQRDFAEACVLADDSRIFDFLERSPGDHVSALRQLPRKQLMMYVHAYQSLLFNRKLRELVKEESLGGLEGLSLPLVGFDTEDDVYDSLLEADGLSKRSFVIKELPDATCEGTSRKAVIRVEDLVIGELEDDELNPERKKCVVSFSLPKGSYATVVVDHLFDS